MTFAPHYTMPGTFHFDLQPASGVHPGIFQPPVSPPSAASSTYLTKSTGSLNSENPAVASNTKRKRTRDHDRDSTPLQEWGDVNMHLDGAGDSRYLSPAGGRKPSYGEMRYALAGQIDTPNAHVNGNGEVGMDEDSVYSDVNYRRELGSKRPLEETESPAGRYTTLVKPQPPPPHPSDGWSRLALEALGGMVGKVWEFCKTGAFRGFYAGGGTGYAVSTSPALQNAPAPAPAAWCVEHDTPTLNQAVPGGFPESDHMPFSPDYLDRATPEPTPSRPAAKRRQLSENDELRRNWVMVDDPVEETRRKRPLVARRQQPSRNMGPSVATGRRISVPVSRLGANPGLPRRHSNRISHAGSPSLHSREPASFAPSRSPRASSPAISTPSRIPVPSRPGSSLGPNPFAAVAPAQPAAVPSPIQTNFDSSHRRTHSGASAASPRGPPSTAMDAVENSPRLDAEAKHLAARRMREERDTDVRMATFNARLKEMIRQGKEALGTRVEVDGGDGGWEDEE